MKNPALVSLWEMAKLDNKGLNMFLRWSDLLYIKILPVLNGEKNVISMG